MVTAIVPFEESYVSGISADAMDGSESNFVLPLLVQIITSNVFPITEALIE